MLLLAQECKRLALILLFSLVVWPVEELTVRMLFQKTRSWEKLTMQRLAWLLRSSLMVDSAKSSGILVMKSGAAQASAASTTSRSALCLSDPRCLQETCVWAAMLECLSWNFDSMHVSRHS